MPEKQTSDDPLRVVVFADFVCPYSYLAVDQIDRLAREYDVKPLWRPHWLHPDTPLEGAPRESTPDNVARRELRGMLEEMIRSAGLYRALGLRSVSRQISLPSES